MKQRGCWFWIVTLLTVLVGKYFVAAGLAAERCEPTVGRVVSVQGNVQAKLGGETRWIPVRLNDTFCPGDMIRVQERSRAAVVLPNEAILRLDQKTTITFNGIEKETTSLIDMLRGAIHFFSRMPRGLRIATPFVNGTVEGTEFLAKVDVDQTFLSIFEGRVLAENEVGSLLLASGDSATTRRGEAPQPVTVVHPRDAVQWALYYPPVIDYRPADFEGGSGSDWLAQLRRSINAYWEGDLARAFAELEGAPPDIRDPRFYDYRAGLLLTVGRVDEASADIDRALALDGSNANAFALQAIIAVVQNQKDKAFDLASRAVELDRESSVAKVALSYTQQARFDLQGALQSLQEAVKLGPENALANARLAELWLSLGYLDKALEVAKEAVRLRPNLERTQTILGFAYVAQIKIREAKEAFEKAIQLDTAAPLSRLGLGLAKIREGNVKPGVEEIAIAASLDPNNSLIRSYLGKGYFEEKRDSLAEDQYKIAKELDPMDPTPYFYDAIRKQLVNRPIEALHDLQKSIELNENRAVYRSRLQLDEDLAARSASIGRIYRDLGFEQRALVEGWTSVNVDPSNYSGHRFLADSYSTLPRHQIARVSELLQSQLLQPLNVTPIQPTLAEPNILFLEGQGPASPAFNEFNPLFNRDRLALQFSGVLGEQSSVGDELVHSAVLGRWSYSLGQFHIQTDGFRENNDQTQNIYNLYFQVEASPKTSVQAEYRERDVDQGDLSLFFDPDNFFPSSRDETNRKTVRLGLKHAFEPNSVLIANFSYLKEDSDLMFFPGATSDVEQDGYMGEAQHIFRTRRADLIGGAGYFNADSTFVDTVDPDPPFIDESGTRHGNAYLYTRLKFLDDVVWTVGASADFFDDGTVDRDQVNPKLGVIWNPFPSSYLRAAAFRTLKRSLVSDQTLEPTQVAGFNQFFDDGNGDDTWRYGVGFDQRFSSEVYAGIEFTKRDIEVTGKVFGTGIARSFDIEEYLHRLYAYYTPFSWLALSFEYHYELFKRPLEFTGLESVTRLETHRASLAFNFFDPGGLFATLKPTYVDQSGGFFTPAPFPDPLGTVTDDSDNFLVFDLSVGYRFPKRYGIFTINAKNLFNQTFNFQDTDPARPVISPERVFALRWTFAF
jgi:tetratricopeptide (TPR) repeat protein